MSKKIKTIQSVYEVTSKAKFNNRGIIRDEEIKVRVYLHDGYIEIIDEDMDKKSFIFAGKDSPEKRKMWLEVLKTIETAIKLTPQIGKE